MYYINLKPNSLNYIYLTRGVIIELIFGSCVLRRKKKFSSKVIGKKAIDDIDSVVVTSHI